MKPPFTKSLLVSTCCVMLLVTATQAESARIENVTVYAGKQSEVAIDLNVASNRLSNPAHAAITPGGPYLKNQLPLLNEQAYDIALAGHYAFVAMAGDGLLVIDISDGIAPTVVDRIKPSHPVKKLSVVGDHLYIAGNRQLSIVDITQPLDAKIIGEYQTPSSITDLDVAASGLGILLLADNSLLALNLVVPTNPQRLSTTLPDGTVHDVVVKDTRIYLAMGDAGIAVLNSSNPAAITTLYRYATSGAAVGLAQSNGVLYVATTTAGLTLFDIETDNRFIWLGSHQKVGNVISVGVLNDRVMVLNEENQLALLDAGMPNMPSIIATYSDPRPDQQPLTAFVQFGKRLLAVSHHTLFEYDFSTPPPQISNEGLDFGQGVNFGGQRRGFIRGHILYVADWFSGIHLYDISEPHQPRLLSSLRTKGSPKGIVVRDDYAYVADDDHGLLIVDISDPNQPQQVSTLPTPGLAYIPQLQGDLLYLASHRGGFQIIDISDASKPRLLSSFNTAGKAWGIQVRGDLTYIADDEPGLLVFDTSDPAAPKQIGQFNPGGAAEDVLVDGNYAFVTFFDNGLFIVDISDPTSPTQIGHVATPGNARGIERRGDHLYIADWLGGMQVINISEPMQPRIVGSFDTEGAAWGLRLNGDHAYIFDWWGGLAVLDIQTPERPTLLGRYLGNDTIQQITTRDKFLFAASGIDGLQIFDINNPLNPTWFTGVNLESPAIGIAIEGDYAYVAQGNRYISVIDIANPFQSELLKQIKLDHNADIVRAANHQLYVAERGTAVTVIDIENPQAPLIRTTYHVPLTDLWNDASTLYLTTANQRLEIIDSSDPAILKRTLSLALATNAELLRTDGVMLYLYQPAHGILMVDISNPERPRPAGQIPVTMQINDFQIEGSTLYIAADGRYVLKYDITNPQQWRLISRYRSSGQIDRFDLHNGVLYFSGSSNIIALQPLPDLNLAIDATTHQLHATLPREMPPGGYHLIIADREKKNTTLFNAINIKMKPFGKPGFTLQDLKKAMDEQKSNSDTR